MVKELTTAEWSMLVARLAYRYLNIFACPHCGYPMVSGYICTWCKKDPSEKVEEE